MTKTVAMKLQPIGAHDRDLSNSTVHYRKEPMSGDNDRALIVPMLRNAIVDACEKSQAAPVEVLKAWRRSSVLAVSREPLIRRKPW